MPDMFCNFYLSKNHKIVNNSATTIEEIIQNWIPQNSIKHDVCLAKFKKLPNYSEKSVWFGFSIFYFNSSFLQVG